MENTRSKTKPSIERVVSNEDLLTEILLRLPAASILRFKSVCKYWRTLLSHTRFTHRYDDLSKPVGLIGRQLYIPYDVENRSPPPFRSLDFYFNRSNVKIEQSCNGLLLCSTDHNRAREYYVFNPTTKQLAFIPSVPKYSQAMALAFHRTHCVHYKVICVRATDPDGELFQIQVYSSDTRKWKICIQFFCENRTQFSHPVYYNGAVHWAPLNQSSCNFLYFTLDVEKLRVLPGPKELVDSSVYDDVYDEIDEYNTMYFGESRGHLHLISHWQFEDGTLILKVFEMLADRSGWIVKYRVWFDELSGFTEMGLDLGVVDVVRGKEEEDTFLVLVYRGKVMRYNVRDKSFNQIYGHGNEYYNDETSSVRRYIETLSSF